MSYYAADGSVNITVVDGNTRTGQTAPDGSRYVTTAGTQGYHHPCGAMRATVSSGKKVRQAPDGSIYVTEAPYTEKEALRVTVVSGTL